MRFREESSRIIHEMGNIELYELGQMTRTVQCYSCWKHLPEGLAFCSCGVCLRSDEATIKRIKARFQDLIVPYRSMAKLSGNKIIGKQWTPEEEHGNVVRTLLTSGGTRMRSTEILSMPMDGRKNVADTWTTSRRSTSLAPLPGIGGTGTRAP